MLPLAEALSQTALDILKYAFLALLFLFLARVMRVVILELRSPVVAGAPGTAGAGGGRSAKAGARLRIIEPPARKGETYPLNEELTVGRGGGCGVVIPDDQFVSTVHARLFRRGSDLFVEDLGSRNGTFVNGTQVKAATRLKRGDRVQFGETVGEVLPVTIRLAIGDATDTGRVRDHNEDGYLVDDGLGLVVVADGMGGHAGGEVASATAIEALHASFAATGGLRDAVLAANDAVVTRANADDSLRGMGTTLTAGVLGDDGTLIVAHVGDSRAYLLRDGELTRITTDHSLVEELMAAGELTAEEAERDPRRSMITRVIGFDGDLDVDLHPVVLVPGDRVMLCSDGLTNMVSDEAIADMLGHDPDPAAAAQHLVDAANAAGGIDNITVLVVDAVGDLPEEEVAPRKRRGILRRRA